MIHVNDRELARAFNEHFGIVSKLEGRSGAENVKHKRSYLLILYYAVECGLKALCLKRNKWKTTENVHFSNKNYGHDLLKILNDLGAPAEYKVGLGEVKITKNNSFTYERSSTAETYHQMWRYGAQPAENNQNSILCSKLETISEWITRELRCEN